MRFLRGEVVLLAEVEDAELLEVLHRDTLPSRGRVACSARRNAQSRPRPSASAKGGANREARGGCNRPTGPSDADRTRLTVERRHSPCIWSTSACGSSPSRSPPTRAILYLSAQHREALAHLLYGVRSEGGFVQLTGEVGTGKTTVCRCFLEQLPPGTHAAVILNPRPQRRGAARRDLRRVRDPARRTAPASVKASLDRINRFLLEAHAAGERAVLRHRRGAEPRRRRCSSRCGCSPTSRRAATSCSRSS